MIVRSWNLRPRPGRYDDTIGLITEGVKLADRHGAGEIAFPAVQIGAHAAGGGRPLGALGHQVADAHQAQLGEGGEEVLSEVEGHQPTLATRLGPIKLVSACQRRGLSGVRWRRNSGASPNTATA